MIILRTDLKMSVGKKVAQGAHAAVQVVELSRVRNAVILREWMHTGQKKIVLKCPNLEKMIEIQKRAAAAGFVHALITDAGRTQIPSGSVTALGIGPVRSSSIDPITGDLKLL